MAANQSEYIITITSRDRIGIVFEISNALAELAGNIADSRQSLMCGYYTMILRAAFPGSLSQETIERKLAEVDTHSATALHILVNPVEETLVSSEDSENNYVLTVSGTDQIGFVALVAGFCVEHRVNITDLSTTLSDGEFIMMLQVDLKGCESVSTLRQDLAAFGREHALKVVLQHHDIFRAVNEISLPIRQNREK